MDSIYCQLERAVECAPDKEVVRNLDIAYAVEEIVYGQMLSVVVDEAYLIVYHVGNPWYSRRTMLSEAMILRIGAGSSFRRVVETLDYLADLHNADAIVVGGALSPRTEALTRLYRRYGYVDDDSPTLVKRR